MSARWPWSAVRWLWIALSLLLLIATMFLFDGSANSDADIVLGYGLLVLSFPTGPILAALDGYLGRAIFSAFGLISTTTYATLTITWLIYTVVGYLQWFV
ncbi:MAG: hypothetical protein K8F93_12440 [Burkholderiales bacterium]|nr:hypothetical protein [Burkholderiales bacterium]